MRVASFLVGVLAVAWSAGLLADQVVFASDAAKLRVGLFVDRGCAGNGLARWAELLDASPDADLKILSGKAIREGGLAGLDLLVMPGGRGDWQYEAIGAVGAQAIRDYVAGGGKYYGTCCGIALALNEDTAPFKRLRMLPFRRVPGRPRGGFDATVAFNARGQAFLGLDAEGAHRSIRYHNGPILQTADAVALATNVEVLATMDCELSQEGAVQHAMYGTPAAVRADYGRGELLAFNCHPETNADSRDLIAKGIRALTGRPFRFGPDRTPTGKVRVGFMTGGLGAKPRGVEKYLQLVHDPTVFVVPLTADEVRAGYGESMDRIVKPEEIK